MKAFITGSEGFVGGYLKAELKAHGYQVIGADLTEGSETRKLDLLDGEAVFRILSEEKPDAVFHLAAMADVGYSWKQPQRTFRVNVEAAVNLMEALRRMGGTDIRTVLVGSSDQYGALGAAGASVSEKTEMRPMSPYAVSKKAQEEMAALYARSYGLSICMTRSFNHGGAGQRTGFLIPDFASGIVRIERGEATELLVGNLASRRDFTHVRDVVRAYRLIAERGKTGEVYNVGSGETHSVEDVLNRMRAMARCPIPIRMDPRRMRPSDTPVICCDHTKLTRDTGWQPELSFQMILQDTLAYYRAK